MYFTNEKVNSLLLSLYISFNIAETELLHALLFELRNNDSFNRKKFIFSRSSLIALCIIINLLLVNITQFLKEAPGGNIFKLLNKFIRRKLIVRMVIFALSFMPFRCFMN